jgi:hypothetical protein
MANKIWRLPIEGCIGVVSTVVKTKRLTEIREPT